MTDVPMHQIEPIVTPDRFEYGAHRMRVPGGWLYWLTPGGGSPVCSFVPLPAEPAKAMVPWPQASVARAV